MCVHDLRHLLISILLVEGLDPRFVGEYVGHSSPYTTLSMYAHMLPGEQQRATTVLEDRLG